MSWASYIDGLMSVDFAMKPVDKMLMCLFLQDRTILESVCFQYDSNMRSVVEEELCQHAGLGAIDVAVSLHTWQMSRAPLLLEPHPLA